MFSRKVVDAVVGAPPPIGERRSLFTTIKEARDAISTVGQLTDDVDAIIAKIRATVIYDANNDLVDTIIKRVEQILIVGLQLTRCTNIVDALLATTQYLGTLTSKPLSKTAYDLITELLDEVVSEQPDVQAGMAETWTALKGSRSNKMMGIIINVLIMAGFMPEHADGFLSKEMYKVLQVRTAKKSLDDDSIIDHIFNALDWVMNALVPFAYTHDPSYLIESSDVIELDDRYRLTKKAITLFNDALKEQLTATIGGNDFATLSQHIVQTIAMHEAHLKLCKDKYTREAYNRRIIGLDHALTDLTTKHNQDPLREKPEGNLVKGPSGVGKSSFVHMTDLHKRKCAGQAQGHEYMNVLNTAEHSFQSGHRPFHLSVLMDDCGGTKFEREKENPLFIILQMLNNIHCAALSPIAEEKGKNWMRMTQVWVTTNTEDCGASYFMNSAAATMRRFENVITLGIRPGYEGPNGMIKQPDEGDGPIDPNAWEVTVEHVKLIRKENMRDTYVLVPAFHKGVELTKVSYRVYLAYAVDSYLEHLNFQRRLVEYSTKQAAAPCCLKCQYSLDADMYCYMCDTSVDTQGYFDTFSMARERDTDPIVPDPLPFILEEDEAEGVSVIETLSAPQRLRKFCTEEYVPLMPVWRKYNVPSLPDNPWVLALMAIGTAIAVGFLITRMYARTIEPQNSGYTILAASALPARPGTVHNEKYKRVAVVNRKVGTSEASKSTPYDTFMGILERNVNNFSIQEVDWKTQTPRGNITYVSGTPIKSSTWMLPHHPFEPGATYRVCGRTAPTSIVGIPFVDEIVDQTSWAPMLDSEGNPTDQLLLRLPNRGSNRDIEKFFVESTDTSVGDYWNVYYRPKVVHTGDELAPLVKVVARVTALAPINPRTLSTTPYSTYQAVQLLYSEPTFPGMCGAIAVRGGKYPAIVGVHVAGVSGHQEGYAVLVTRPMLQECMSRLPDPMASSVPFDPSGMGKSYEISDDVHPHHCVHYIEESDNANIEIIGQHSLGTARPTQDLVDSCIKSAVLEALDVPVTHIPVLKSGVRKSYRTSIRKITTAKRKLKPALIRLATEDYKETLSRAFAYDPRFPAIAQAMVQLDYKTAVSGAPGVRGVDSIAPNTSIGFPLMCSKGKFMIQVIDDDGNVRNEFDELKLPMETFVIQDADAFAKGDRVNAVFRVTPKMNESLKIEKVVDGKVRIICGCPGSLLVLSRMLYVATVAALLEVPDVTECCMGVDMVGPDCQHVYDHITRFGTDRIVNGDFTAFDQTLSPDLIMAGYECLNHAIRQAYIVQKREFPEALGTIMNGIATECALPILEMDGVIMQTFGMRPSGEPITTYGNSNDNSLYMRMAYYYQKSKLLPGDAIAVVDKEDLFCDNVSLATYGDDGIGSVSTKCTWFDHVKATEFFDSIDVGYTMGVKDAVSVPFIDIKDSTFLARDFVAHSKLGGIIGRLREESIIKSLLYVSSDLPEGMCRAEHSAQVLADARAAYFYHEDIYEKRRDQLDAIAAEICDEQGNKVSDFYKPRSEEDIISAYKMQPCAYNFHYREIEVQGDVCIFEYEPCTVPLWEPPTESMAILLYRFFGVLLTSFAATVLFRLAPRLRISLYMRDWTRWRLICVFLALTGTKNMIMEPFYMAYVMMIVRAVHEAFTFVINEIDDVAGTHNAPFSPTQFFHNPFVWHRNRRRRPRHHHGIEVQGDVVFTDHYGFPISDGFVYVPPVVERIPRYWPDFASARHRDLALNRIHAEFGLEASILQHVEVLCDYDAVKHYRLLRHVLHEICCTHLARFDEDELGIQLRCACHEIEHREDMRVQLANNLRTLIGAHQWRSLFPGDQNDYYVYPTDSKHSEIIPPIVRVRQGGNFITEAKIFTYTHTRFVTSDIEREISVLRIWFRLQTPPPFPNLPLEVNRLILEYAEPEIVDHEMEDEPPYDEYGGLGENNQPGGGGFFFRPCMQVVLV